MSESNDILSPCDPAVFTNGKSLLAVDTYECKAMGFDSWVRSIAESSGQRVDWHYSGGVAHVLYLGDRTKILEAMNTHPCPGHVMRIFEETDPGLYRKDVTPVPDRAIMGWYEGGPGNIFT